MTAAELTQIRKQVRDFGAVPRESYTRAEVASLISDVEWLCDEVTRLKALKVKPLVSRKPKEAG